MIAFAYWFRTRIKHNGKGICLNVVFSKEGDVKKSCILLQLLNKHILIIKAQRQNKLKIEKKIALRGEKNRNFTCLNSLQWKSTKAISHFDGK